MDAQQFPICLLATVAKEEKYRDVKNRDYRKVGFLVDLDQPSYFDGDDLRSRRTRRVYIDGTKEVADIIAAQGGLKLDERVYLRVVEIGAFGGDGRDDQGRQRTPMVKFAVDRIELPGRKFKNRSLSTMADKVKAKDAGAEAEARVLAGATK